MFAVAAEKIENAVWVTLLKTFSCWFTLFSDFIPFSPLKAVPKALVQLTLK